NRGMANCRTANGRTANRRTAILRKPPIRHSSPERRRIAPAFVPSPVYSTNDNAYNNKKITIRFHNIAACYGGASRPQGGRPRPNLVHDGCVPAALAGPAVHFRQIFAPASGKPREMMTSRINSTRIVPAVLLPLYTGQAGQVAYGAWAGFGHPPMPYGPSMGCGRGTGGTHPAEAGTGGVLAG